MSMQTPRDPNPFAIASRFLANKYKEGARNLRDSDQHTLTQTTLAMHAAQHESTKRQAAQQARLTERAEQGKHERAVHFVNTIQGFAQPGAQVSITHGGISASYTPAMPAAPKAGRVPVKKVRGGKRPR